MLFYKNFIGYFNYDVKYRIFVGYITEVTDEIYFNGYTFKEIQFNFKVAVDKYLKLQKIVNND